MNERLTEQRKLPPQLPMAARAVALCEGCPMAKFCVTKEASPCETPQVRQVHIESGGGGYGEMIDKPIRESYLEDLFDPTKLTVMAELQKRKEKQRIQAKVIERGANRASAQARKAEIVKSRVQAPVPPKAKVASERPSENGSDIIAGIFASMIGVNGLATARDKRSV